MSHWSLPCHLPKRKPGLLAQSHTSFFPHVLIHPPKPHRLLPSSGAQQTYNLKACFKCYDFGMSFPVWLDVSLSVFLGCYICIGPCRNSSSWKLVFPSVQQVPLTQSRVPHPVTRNPERLPLPAQPHHLHEAVTPRTPACTDF